MNDTVPSKRAQTVRAIVDFGGLGVFLVVYLVAKFILHQDRLDAMMTATWGLVGGSAVALLIGFVVERRVAPLPLFAGLAALGFGGLTLFFHDPVFIKVKPTVINLALGGAMLGGLALRKNPLKVLFGSSLTLTEAAWNRLTLRFGLFYLSMALLNEIVWRTQSETIWVFFRFPGLQLLSLAFVFSQLPMMMRDMKAAQTAVEVEL